MGGSGRQWWSRRLTLIRHFTYCALLGKTRTRFYFFTPQILAAAMTLQSHDTNEAVPGNAFFVHEGLKAATHFTSMLFTVTTVTLQILPSQSIPTVGIYESSFGS